MAGSGGGMQWWSVGAARNAMQGVIVRCVDGVDGEMVEYRYCMESVEIGR